MYSKKVHVKSAYKYLMYIYLRYTQMYNKKFNLSAQTHRNLTKNTRTANKKYSWIDQENPFLTELSSKSRPKKRLFTKMEIF